MVVLGIVAVLVLLALIIYLGVTLSKTKTDEVVILSGSQSGKQEAVYGQPLPRSFNQSEGIVYSYTGWILVNDFTVGYGKARNILTKGNSPGIALDTTSNSLVFSIKTYGTTETVLVPNVPAAKWIHFAIVVNQQATDIYINGMLRQHHTLSQLPDQTENQVVMGGEWDGVLGRVSYFPRTLSSGEIQAKAAETPPTDLHPSPSSPQYFDLTWYTGRLNST
jgi:hypothetical protein